MIQSGNLCGKPLKKVNFEVMNHEANRHVVVKKNIIGSSPNNALSIHTANSPSQSRDKFSLIFSAREQNEIKRLHKKVKQSGGALQ